ncbi:hypothetical protein QBC34DRAFT_411216, partial [Podospora aff. communis PSN243]
MKFSILAALASRAFAAPATLSARQNPLCGAYGDMTDTTSATSPLVSDCQVLYESNLTENWTPSEANGFVLDLKHGTCGFRARFDQGAGSLPASETFVSSEAISIVFYFAIERFAVDGRVSAKGDFMCL